MQRKVCISKAELKLQGKVWGNHGLHGERNQKIFKFISTAKYSTNSLLICTDKSYVHTLPSKENCRTS